MVAGERRVSPKAGTGPLVPPPSSRPGSPMQGAMHLHLSPISLSAGAVASSVPSIEITRRLIQLPSRVSHSAHLPREACCA